VIVCLDIEHFKLFKNTYGQEAGDRLLLHAAGLFSGKASDHGGIASRFFSDIFALYLPGPLIDLATIESEALDWFSSYSADQRVIPAIGVNVIEDPTVSVSVMCAEKALRERQFEVYLQPKCNIETGRIIGSEALVRWNHPQYGMVSPGVFIPLFEKSGFIIKLDAYVWEEVCSFIRQWRDAGHTPIPASVNVSRRDLYTPNLCDRLERLVSKYDIPPHLLELEITESAYVEDTDQMIDVIDRLREKGFVILMDDFGSGYSSLNILKDINVDILKIDLRFLEDLNSSGKKGQNILESIVHLSKWLHMQVIAEGVETQEQVDFL
jgi:EAL domain-containing protein (putative c-di-GMP-specific phosphodiesterase class I)